MILEALSIGRHSSVSAQKRQQFGNSLPIIDTISKVSYKPDISGESKMRVDRRGYLTVELRARISIF